MGHNTRSSPISVSMITFSGRAGTGEDWLEQRGDKAVVSKAKRHVKMAEDLDMQRDGSTLEKGQRARFSWRKVGAGQ